MRHVRDNDKYFGNGHYVILFYLAKLNDWSRSPALPKSLEAFK